jgi:hypothetical protein
MNKRFVWTFCFIIALVSVASVAYRLASPSHFDSTTWRDADEPSEFLDRRTMMPDLNRMFDAGQIKTRDQADKILGHPERRDENDDNVWFYNLGGQRSPSAPDSVTWLELTFDREGKLIKHRTTQELIVPTPG